MADKEVRVGDLLELSRQDTTRKAKMVYFDGHGRYCAIGGVANVLMVDAADLGYPLSDIYLTPKEQARAEEQFPKVFKKSMEKHGIYIETVYTLITQVNDFTTLKKQEVFEQVLSVLNKSTLKRVVRISADW